jgi:hypothetical protein
MPLYVSYPIGAVERKGQRNKREDIKQEVGEREF